MDSSQEAEWKKAQAISISCDLVGAAKQQLKFLASVDRYPCLYQGPAVERAITRYEQCWLPLLASQTETSRLVPPLDCEWVWHCHKLNPLQYENDCLRFFGRLLDAPTPCGKDSHASAMNITAKLWENAYPTEPFSLDLDAADHFSEYKSQRHMRSDAPRIQYDLAAAIIRQRSFFYQVSLPHMSDERFLRAAEERYKGYLYLIKKCCGKSFNVPTYDIDLMWHSHQLNPVAYRNDMVELLGKVLGHDDTDSDRSHGKKLDVGFAETTKEWERTFGRRYWKAGAMYRGGEPKESYIKCSNQDEHRKQSMQVMLDVVRARNINVKEVKGTSVFVRYYVKANRNGNKVIALNTKEVSASSQPEWRETLCLECGTQGKRDIASEVRSEFIVFEVRVRGGGLIGGMRGSKMIGRVEIPWRDLLDSPTLSIENWFPLSINGGQIKKESIKPPSLHIALSVTPPVVAPIMRSHEVEKKMLSTPTPRRKVSPLALNAEISLGIGNPIGNSCRSRIRNVNIKERARRLERDECGCGGGICLNGHDRDERIYARAAALAAMSSGVSGSSCAGGGGCGV
eukprot:Gb_25938 [translate_table: standard]